MGIEKTQQENSCCVLEKRMLQQDLMCVRSTVRLGLTPSREIVPATRPYIQCSQSLQTASSTSGCRKASRNPLPGMQQMAVMQRFKLQVGDVQLHVVSAQQRDDGLPASYLFIYLHYSARRNSSLPPKSQPLPTNTCIGQPHIRILCAVT